MSKTTEKKKFIVRMSPELHSQATEAADEVHISLNSFVLQAISEKLKRGEWLDEAATQAQRSKDDGR